MLSSAAEPVGAAHLVLLGTMLHGGSGEFDEAEYGSSLGDSEEGMHLDWDDMRWSDWVGEVILRVMLVPFWGLKVVFWAAGAAVFCCFLFCVDACSLALVGVTAAYRLCGHLLPAFKPVAKQVLPYYMAMFDAATAAALHLWRRLLLHVKERRRAQKRRLQHQRHARQPVHDTSFLDGTLSDVPSARSPAATASRLKAQRSKKAKAQLRRSSQPDVTAKEPVPPADRGAHISRSSSAAKLPADDLVPAKRGVPAAEAAPRPALQQPAQVAPPRPQQPPATRAAAPSADWMLCPITQEVMVDPVLLTGDQHTYERAAIEAWLASHEVSPVTGLQLSSKDVVPNHALRSMIGKLAVARS